MPDCGHACNCSRGPNVEDSKWKGICSYLHFFNKGCSKTGLSHETLSLCPRQPWVSLCWKITLSIGTLLLVLGLAAIVTAFAVPSKLVSISEGEFLILERGQRHYNGVLGTYRLLGIVLCTVAGVLLVVCLFWTIMDWVGYDPEAELLYAETESESDMEDEEEVEEEEDEEDEEEEDGHETQQHFSPIYQVDDDDNDDDDDDSEQSSSSLSIRHFGQSSVQNVQPRRRRRRRRRRRKQQEL